MNASGASLWEQPDVVKEFQFDGAYAGAASTRKDNGRSQRQPKRRGLWQSCFAPPLADEAIIAVPSQSAPSRLALTAKHLQYQRPGAKLPDVLRLPLSDICDVQCKWIDVGGSRVSKVTVAFGSGQEPVVIRGLKNPQDLLDALQQQEAARRIAYTPRASPRGAAGAAIGGASAANSSQVSPLSAGAAGSPPRRVTARALFSEPVSATTEPPASATSSGCGSMTLLSPFARSPAQHFTGSAAVAREIRQASSRFASASPISSQAAASPPAAPIRLVLPYSPTGSTPQSTAASRTQAASRLVVPQAPPPPPAPSDSLVQSAALSVSSMAPTSPQVMPHPAPRTIGSSPPATAEDSMMVWASSRQSPQGSPRRPPRIVGGSSPSIAEDSVLGDTPVQLTPPESPHALPHIAGGSPPPPPEDSVMDTASMHLSAQGSPRPMRHVAGGLPPPMPEDSVMCGASTPPSALSSASAPRGGTLSQGSWTAGGGDLFAAASLSPMLASRQPTLGDEQLSRSVSGSTSASAAPTPMATPALLPHQYTKARSEFSMGTAASAAAYGLPADVQTSSQDLGLKLSTPGADLSSPARTPRLQCAQQQQQRPLNEGTHRLSHSSATVPASPDAGSSDQQVDPQGGASTFQAEAGETRQLLISAGGTIVHDSKGVTRVGAMGIAAAAATMSAVLTSAASASLISMSLAAAPSLGGAASVAAGSVAVAASAAVAPLTLMGITAAAAMTLVAAAAVTHIRTGSPVAPLPDSCNVDVIEAQTLRDARASRSAELVLSPPPKLRLGQAGSLDWLRSAKSISKSNGEPVVAHSSVEAGVASPTSFGDLATRHIHQASSSSARQVPSSNRTTGHGLLVTVASTATADGNTDEAAPTVEPTTGGSSARVAERRPFHGGGVVGSPSLAGGSSNTVGTGARGVSGVTVGSGDGSEDAVTDGGWGSQRTLVDSDAEPGTLPARSAATWPGVAIARAHPTGSAGAAAAAAAPVAADPLQHAHATAPYEEEGIFPVMLFSGGPGGMPPLERGTEESQALPNGTPSHGQDYSRGAEAGGQGVVAVVHGGELRPPPAAAAATAAAPEYSDSTGVAPSGHQLRQQPSLRDPTVRQLFSGEEETHPRARHLQQQPALQASRSNEPKQQGGLAPESEGLPVACGAGSVVASPLAAWRRRPQQQLSESPVRVLYSVHTSFMGLDDPRAQRGVWDPPHTCESSVQTDGPMGPLAECAVQTESGARATSVAVPVVGAELAALASPESLPAGSRAASRSSRDAEAGGHGRSLASSGASSRGSGAAGRRLQSMPMAESALQQVYTLDSPADGASGSAAPAVVAHEQQCDLAPPMAGAQDWYMSSRGADQQQCGSEFDALKASVGGTRRSRDGSASTSCYQSAGHSSSSLSSEPQSSSFDDRAHGLAASAAGVTVMSRGSTHGSRHDPGVGIVDADGASIVSEDRIPLRGNARGRQYVGSSSGDGVHAPALLSAPVHFTTDSTSEVATTAPSAALSTEEAMCIQQRQQQQPGGLDEERSSSSSDSDSETESPSVDSGLYSPMASNASSGSFTDRRNLVGAWGRVSGAKEDPGSIDMAVGALEERPRRSTDGVYGNASDSAAAAPLGAASSCADKEDDSRQWLLSPGVGLSAEPPRSTAPRASVFTSEGASSLDGYPGVGSLEVSMGAAEQPSLHAMVSDTAEDMGWLLGATGGGASDDGTLATSAPASPRNPPPPMGSQTLHGGCRLRAGAADEATSCSSRRSSIGSCGQQINGRRQESRAPGSASAASRNADAGANAGSNQLVTPRSFRPGFLGLHGADGNLAPGPGPCTSTGCSSDGSSSRRRPSSGFEPTVAALAFLGVADLPTASGGSSSASPSSETSNPARNAVGSEATSQALPLSPDLSDISSTAFAGVYGYGSPGPWAYDTPRVTRLQSEGGALGSTFGGADPADAAMEITAVTPSPELSPYPLGEDLFLNPLYITPGKDVLLPAAQSLVRNQSSGTIALPLMPYLDGLAYGGSHGDEDGTSSYTSSLGPFSRATSHPSVGSEGPLSGGRRRRCRETTSGRPIPHCSGGASETGRVESRTTATPGDNGLGSVISLTAPQASDGALSEAGDGTTAGSDASGSGSGSCSSALPQRCKRARTRMPDAPLFLPQAAASTPAGPEQPRDGRPQNLAEQPLRAQKSGAAPPLASPLMVLNPTYAQSEAGASSVVASPRNAAYNGASAAATESKPRRQDGCAGADADGTMVVATPVAAAVGASGDCVGVDGQGIGPLMDAGGKAPSSTPGHTTPKQMVQAQLLLGSPFGLSSFQGSPSSQQAAHAAALLRHANDAVDFARDAVQRGDVQWLSRVTTTLQAVQTALDALREF